MSTLTIAHAPAQTAAAVAPAGTSHIVVPSTGYRSHTACQTGSLDMPRAWILVTYDNKHVPRGPIPANPQEENVYDLIPLLVPPPPKHERYRSKHAGLARQEYKQGLKANASMGTVKVAVSGPSEFLRKNQGLRSSVPVSPAAPSPKLKDVQATLHATTTISRDKAAREAAAKAPKNYIRANALEAVNAVAKQAKPDAPRYTQLKNYGKVPEYLDERKQERARQGVEAEERKEQEERNAILASGLIPLPEDERVRILDNLKGTWEKLNSEYMRLSLTVDTVPKINKKVSLENALKQLETDIQKFSHSNILVDFNAVYEHGVLNA